VLAVSSCWSLQAIWWLTGGVTKDFATALRYSAFTSVSMPPTTATPSTDNGQWPDLRAPCRCCFLFELRELLPDRPERHERWCGRRSIFKQIFRELCAHPSALLQPGQLAEGKDRQAMPRCFRRASPLPFSCTFFLHHRAHAVFAGRGSGLGRDSAFSAAVGVADTPARVWAKSGPGDDLRN